MWNIVALAQFAKPATCVFLALTLSSCPQPPANSSTVSPSNPASASDPLEKAILTQKDLEYLGSFAPPLEAVSDGKGGKWSTAYGTGGLALRRVNGELRFFATTHVYSGGLVYEMDFPGLSKEVGKWPRAKVLNEWGDVYGGKRPTHEGDALNGGNWVHGLMWDDLRARLYWSYGHWYNVAQVNNPVLGYADFGSGPDSSSVPKARGHWATADDKVAHSQMARGGTLRIPEWFAQRFTGGKTLGLGFGGYYSGAASTSYGPTLFAAKDPEAGDSALEVQTLLKHPFGGGSEVWAKRSPDYFQDPQIPIGWDKGPENGIGFWTAPDTLEGAALWLETPSKQGVMYFPRLGAGKMCYCGNAVVAERYRAETWIYSPKDLARVAKNEVQPWQVKPSSSFGVDYPKGPKGERGETVGARVTGVAYDSPSQTLYLYTLESYWEGVSLYPLIHAYKIK